MSGIVRAPVRRALGVVAVVGATVVAGPALGQVFAPYEQHRGLDVAAQVQIPPDVSPTVTHTTGEQSDDLGSFDRSLTVTVAAPEGGDPSTAPYASFTTTASHRLAYATATITGAVATGFESREVGAEAGGSADASVDFSFLVNQGGAGRVTAHAFNSGNGGYFVLLFDLDTEDPHGGPSVIWGLGMSGGANDESFDVPISFLAGHRYRFQARTENDLEILRNGPENRTLSQSARFDFTITVPEPAAATLLLMTPLVLPRRRRA